MDGELPNDSSIPPSTVVYRRISPEWYGPPGEETKRVTSAAFQDKQGSLSVALEVVLLELELTPDVVLANHPGYGLVSLSVGLLRQLNLGVIKEPTEAEPWHGCVYGKKTGSVRSRLSKEAKLIRAPIPAPNERS